jgi:hypothetical protein
MKHKEPETIKIECIIIKIGKKEITLTVEEAKSLRKELENLLGREYSSSNWYPYYPVNWPPHIYCGNETTSGLITTTGSETHILNGVDLT